MKVKYLVKLGLLLVILFPFRVSADDLPNEFVTCDYKEKARLNALVSNLMISADYVEQGNSVTFEVTISNFHPDIYIVDTTSNVTYYHNPNQPNPSEIKIGGYRDGQTVKYEIYSVKTVCYDNFITNKYVTLPPYNPYYKDPLCKDIPNYILCKKWAKVNYSYDEFKSQIEKYKKKQNEEVESPNENDDYLNWFISFYIKYYIYILPSIIILGVAGIIILNRQKEFRF